MKKVLEEKTFADVEEVKQKQGRSTKRHQNQIQKLFLSGGKKRVNRCIASNGEYFEGD